MAAPHKHVNEAISEAIITSSTFFGAIVTGILVSPPVNAATVDVDIPSYAR